MSLIGDEAVVRVEGRSRMGERAMERVVGRLRGVCSSRSDSWAWCTISSPRLVPVVVRVPSTAAVSLKMIRMLVRYVLIFCKE